MQSLGRPIALVWEAMRLLRHSEGINSTTQDNIIAHKVLVQQNSFRGRSRLIIVICEDREGVM